jgi:hypothetical protein
MHSNLACLQEISIVVLVGQHTTSFRLASLTTSLLLRLPLLLLPLLQAAQLCPRLTGSCSAEVLQQLCDVVKQGLVLVQGHSFLLGQVGAAAACNPNG